MSHFGYATKKQSDVSQHAPALVLVIAHSCNCVVFCRFLSGQLVKMSGQMSDQYISVKELAAISGKSESTIKRRIQTIGEEAFALNVKVIETGKRKKYLIVKPFGLLLLGVRSNDRSNERPPDRSNERLNNTDNLEVQLKAEQDKAERERLYSENKMLQSEVSHLREQNKSLVDAISSQSDVINKLSLIAGYQSKELTSGAKEDNTDATKSNTASAQLKAVYLFGSLLVLMLFTLLVIWFTGIW